MKAACRPSWCSWRTSQIEWLQWPADSQNPQLSICI
jgi:hypothetical protein